MANLVKGEVFKLFS